RRAQLHHREGRHPVGDRQARVRQGELLAAHLRRQPRHHRQPRPHLPRPGDHPARDRGGRRGPRPAACRGLTRPSPIEEDLPMRQIRLSQALLAAAVGAAALAGCRKEEPAPAVPPPTAAEPAAPAAAPMPAPAPASTASISLGNAIGADNRIAAPQTTFASGDTIHASVETDGPARRLDARWTRKLPRQAGISKVELPATRWRYSAGGRSPSESWGRSSLYSSIHQYAASRTSSRRVNRCWSRTSSRKVRLKRSM